METLEVIAEFKPDTVIRVLKILWNGEPFDLSYKIFHQWKDGKWMHIYSLCEEKKLVFELKYDTFTEWEVLGCEPLN